MAASNGPRERLLMDPGWRFHHGDIPTGRPHNLGETFSWVKGGTAHGAADPDFDDSGWQRVDLPHDWVIEGQFDPKENVTHGFLPTGIGWYRKTFELPAEDEGRRLWLEFDGIFRNSTVWLNGHYLGHHLSGYTSFHYDITDVAHYGEKNVLAVRVDATECEGWWYEGAGIYRHVWLVKTDPLHVAHWGTFVTATVADPLDPEQAEVVIRTEVTNGYDKDMSCKLESTIVDADGNEVATSQSRETIVSREMQQFRQTVDVGSPHLWSVDDPYLYRVLTTVKSNGRITDTYETTFGIRTLKFDAEKGFFLNGKPLKLKGTCNHQDHAGVGTAVPDHLQEYRIRLLKEMGSNAYRCAHNPPTPEVLDACDHLGMLVMDENRFLDSSAERLADLESMVRRDRNHPSIILWSTSNEESLQRSPVGARIVATMADLVRKLDPSRPVTAAMHDSWGSAFSDALDVQGCNYFPEDYDDYHQNHPHQPVIGSETSGTSTTRGIYVTDRQAGYVSAYNREANAFGASTTAEYGWRMIADRPWMGGTFVWTGFDYRGEPTPYEWPCINSQLGMMDMCGFPKDNYYYYQSWWSDETVLHIFPHWNWAGREGEEIDVWCYSNCDRVELFLNGESLGTQEIQPNGHLEWKVPYAPGTLLAVGYRNGEEIARAAVETTGPAAGIQLDPDRKIIRADGQDVVIVNVSVRDEQGRVVPTADNNIHFQVSDNATVLGMGNGDPSSHEPDQPTVTVERIFEPGGSVDHSVAKRRAFNGLCQVIVQASREPGEIILTVQTPGLPVATVIVTAEACEPRAFVPPAEGEAEQSQ